MDDRESMSQPSSLLADDLDRQVFDAINRSIDWEHEEAILRTLPPVTRALWVTTILEDDVKNGGFIQYFYNTAGLHIDYLLAALSLLDEHRFDGVIQQAIDVFLASHDLYERAYAQDAQTHHLVGFSQLYGEPALAKLHDLDKKFRRLDDGMCLRMARIRLINAHRQELLPDVGTVFDEA